jgi:hypothetical protein
LAGIGSRTRKSVPFRIEDRVFLELDWMRGEMGEQGATANELVVFGDVSVTETGGNMDQSGCGHGIHGTGQDAGYPMEEVQDARPGGLGLWLDL